MLFTLSMINVLYMQKKVLYRVIFSDDYRQFISMAYNESVIYDSHC